MFAEIEENDEKELKLLIGNDLYTIIDNYVIGKEGYIADILDKILGIMKIWIEVGYMSNYTYIKAICSLFRERFEKFKDLSRLEEMKDKKFLLKFLKESYIYIKQNLINVNEKILFKYFTISFFICSSPSLPSASTIVALIACPRSRSGTEVTAHSST